MQYGTVYWKSVGGVNLPQEIRNRFSNSSMAITGYEVDQVHVNPDGTEHTIPLNQLYNHHYFVTMVGGTGKLVKVSKSDPRLAGAVYDERSAHPLDDEIWAVLPEEGASSTIFAEGNGGEFRKTFHGYPIGYGQVISSPTLLDIIPMHIDTRNRDYNGTAFRAGPEPTSSLAPPNASYSGLVECPCSTRITKLIQKEFSTSNDHACVTNENVQTADDCFLAGAYLFGTTSSPVNQSSAAPSFPVGCSILQNPKEDVVNWNSGSQGAPCNTSSTKYYASGSALVAVYIDVDTSAGGMQITMTGPSSVWFAVAFNAQGMKDLPYAIIADGNGKVQEQKLALHDAGQTLSQSITVVSNTVQGPTRTVVLKRALKGATANHYTVDPVGQSTIPMLNAYGTSPEFGYHKTKGVFTLNLVNQAGPTCICLEGLTQQLGYMDEPLMDFPTKCAPGGNLAQVHVETTPIFNYIENTFIDCVGSLNITLAVFQLDVV